MISQNTERDTSFLPLKKIPPAYRLTPECMKILGPEDSLKFIRARDTIVKSLPSPQAPSSTSQSNATSKETPSSSLGKQYPSRYAHLISEYKDIMYEDEFTTLCEMGAFTVQSERDEQTSPDPDDNKKILATIVKSLKGIQDNLNTAYARASFSYYHIRNLASFDDTWYFAAIDSGADSSVIGKGWYIEHHVMGPDGKPKHANLIGFNKHLSKRGLPVVCALAIVEVGTTKHLLRIHQAVYNEKADLTLLSDFQIKENGWIIDSTSRRHKSYNPDGQGHQQMQNDDGVIIPFSVRSCLMTFRIRSPTDAEMETMIPVDLTSEAPWDPTLHVDDDDVFAMTTQSTMESPTDPLVVCDPHPSESLN